MLCASHHWVGAAGGAGPGGGVGLGVWTKLNRLGLHWRSGEGDRRQRVDEALRPEGLVEVTAKCL